MNLTCGNVSGDLCLSNSVFTEVTQLMIIPEASLSHHLHLLVLACLNIMFSVLPVGRVGCSFVLRYNKIGKPCACQIPPPSHLHHSRSPHLQSI